MEREYRIFTRIDRCMGCHNCELACGVAHSRSKTLSGAIGESVKPRKRIFVESSGSVKMPLVCRHCENAPCVGVCPTGALTADQKTGLVLYSESSCIGCSFCAVACPFGMINHDSESKVMIKCDGCAERSIPACIEACPTKALQLEGGPEKMRRKELAARLAEAFTMEAN